MRPLSWVPGLPAAFAAALLASACQHDASADFDDGTLPSTDQGGSAAAAGTTSDVGAAGAADEGGAAQSGGSGGKPATAGAGGMTGGAGKPAIGGKGGEETGGTGPAGSGGSTATGGSAGSAQAGTAGGGGKPNPVSDPITIDIRTFEDTTIASCDPNEDFSHDPTLQTDGDFCRYEALLKPMLTEIPAGAQIDKASLTLVCVNPGGQVDVSFITTNWKISSVHYNTRPKSSEPFDTFTCADTGDVITLDVTDALKGWLDGKRQAYGLYLTTEDSDGTDFGSSEAEPADRPVLSVTYTPPAK